MPEIKVAVFNVNEYTYDPEEPDHTCKTYKVLPEHLVKMDAKAGSYLYRVDDADILFTKQLSKIYDFTKLL
jgi:hypothetical protein